MWKIEDCTRKRKIPKENQDRIMVHPIKNGYLVGVFDGHGESANVAEHCARRFPQLLSSIDIEEANRATAPEILEAAFAKVAEETNDLEDGSTASVACLWDNGFIAFATLGDSIVTSMLSKEHPRLITGPHHNVGSNLVERREVESRGGILKLGTVTNPANGMFVQNSRSFGDNDMGGIISRTPTVWKYWIGKGGWVAVTSDGILDPARTDYTWWLGNFAKHIRRGLSAEKIVDKYAPYDDCSLVLCKFT